MAKNTKKYKRFEEYMIGRRKCIVVGIENAKQTSVAILELV